MSKLKKFLLLIPTAFIMLLNCMSFTAFADEINYQDYWIDLSEIPELQSREWIFDSTKDSDNPGFSKYIYAVDTINKASYDEFISGENSTFSFCSYYLDLTNIEFDSNDYSVISLNKVPIQSIEFEFRDGKVHSYVAVTKSYFIRYFLDSGTIQMNDSSSFSGYSLVDESYIDTSKYYIHIESNHPDFPVPDFAGGSDVLNVSVSVEPELSLNHRFSYSDAISSGFTLTVTNRSSRPIQYCMDIHSSDSTLFQYYSYDWVYSEVNSQPAFVNKATKYHYVAANSSDSVFFNYQNINFATDITYYLYVSYGFSLSDSATELFTNGSVGDFNTYPYSDFAVEMHNNSFVLDFSFLDFPFLYKRPNSSDSPYLPYDSDIDRDRYNSSYNALEKEDGSIDYSGKAPDDFYVWDNENIHSSSGIIGGSSSGSSNDGTFKSFASSFNGFFKFISYLFNYLPVGIKNLFLCGFTGIIVIAFVKKVF